MEVGCISPSRIRGCDLTKLREVLGGEHAERGRGGEKKRKCDTSGGGDPDDAKRGGQDAAATDAFSLFD